MAPRLTPAQFAALGRDLDELRARVLADLGDEDREYIHRVVKVRRALEVAGRGLLFLGFLPPAWIAGVGALSLSKFLDNMEIGRSVMHGQYDWMRDPALNSRMFEWDTVAPAENWKHSHNYVHHTYTNILGKDRGIGYGVLRIDPAQKWNPYYLGNQLYAVLLAVFFQWGVMLHDLEAEKPASGEKEWAETAAERRRMWHKGIKQVLKDYALFPALSGPLFLPTLLGNVTANLARNLWAFGSSFVDTSPRASSRSPRRRRRRRPAGSGTTGRCWARRTSPAGRCSTSCRGTCRTRSSTTCSPTSRPGATR